MRAADYTAPADPITIANENEKINEQQKGNVVLGNVVRVPRVLFIRNFFFFHFLQRFQHVYSTILTSETRVVGTIITIIIITIVRKNWSFVLIRVRAQHTARYDESQNTRYFSRK